MIKISQHKDLPEGKMDNNIQYLADGKLIIDQELELSMLYEKGIIGFWTYLNELW